MYSCLYNTCVDINLFSLCLQGWTLAHFTNIILRIDDDAYDPTIAPLESQWKPPRSFSNPGHHRAAIDSLDHSHVIWRSYERRRHIMPFQDICWYSEWIMAGRDRMVCHLPERVFRQYGYVHTWPRLPTDIEALAVDVVAQAFMEFALHVLSHQQRGHPVSDNEPWAHTPAANSDYADDTPPRPVPPYEEVLVKQQWARHPPDPYHIINNIRARVNGVMAHPIVFHNPEKVIRLMQDI